MGLTKKEKRLQRKKEVTISYNILYKPVKEKLDLYKKEMKNKPTPSEKILLVALKKIGIDFAFQKAFFNTEFRCIVDFFISTEKIKIVIEVDGEYHFTEEQKRKDKYRSEWLSKKRGCTIIRFTNKEISNNINECLFKIAKLFLSFEQSKMSNNYKNFSSIIKVESDC